MGLVCKVHFHGPLQPQAPTIITRRDSLKRKRDIWFSYADVLFAQIDLQEQWWQHVGGERDLTVLIGGGEGGGRKKPDFYP